MSKKANKEDKSQRKRFWGATLNNPEEHDEPDIVTFMESKLDICQAIFGQMEIGEEGTVHFQYGIQFRDKKSLKWLKENICPYSNFKSWDKVENLLAYCSKEDTRLDGPYQFGEVKFNGGSSESNATKTVAYLATKSPAELGMLTPASYNAAIKAIGHYNLVTGNRYTGPRQAFWLYGDPGVGKSWYVKSFGAFLKPTSKWWDGYCGQFDVLIDDLELDSGKFIGHFLKLWGDPYGMLDGEVKGGTIPLNFHRLWVTSNYSIEQVFGQQPGSDMLISAVYRRFIQIRCLSGVDSQLLGRSWIL